MNKLFVPLLFLLIFPFQQLKAQKEADISIVLLTNQTLAQVNFNEERFLNYTAKVTEEIKSLFEKDLAKRDVIMLFCIRKDTIPDILIAARPALSADSTALILSKIRKQRPIYSKLIDYYFLFEITTNGGCIAADLDYSPKIENPYVLADRQFAQASLAEKNQILQEWSRKEVLPILAAFAEKADEQFKGVRVTGDRVSDLKLDSALDIKVLSDYSSYYWLGIMEMEINNFLVMGLNVFLHVAKGEFDIARSYTDMLKLFKHDKTITDYYLDELDYKLSLFYTELDSFLQIGKELYNQDKFKLAVNYYEELLKSYPNSALLKYEIHQADYNVTISIDPISLNRAWASAKTEIFRCDPLFPSGESAIGEKEIWLNLRRGQINELFKIQGQEVQDFISYADIALDLEAFEFAAHMYWLIFTHFSEKDFGKRNILAYYLYCLDKLGQTEIVMLFDINAEKEFKRILKERRKMMEESEVYQNIKSQEK